MKKLKTPKVFKTPADIKSDGMQIFNVPNNAKGRAFKKQINKYLNHKKYRIHSRGRGTRPSRRYHDALPLSMSGWMAVYLNDSPSLYREKSIERTKRWKEEEAKDDELISLATQVRMLQLDLKETHLKLAKSTEANEELTRALRVRGTAPVPVSVPVSVPVVPHPKTDLVPVSTVSETVSETISEIKAKYGQTVVIRIGVE